MTTEVLDRRPAHRLDSKNHKADALTGRSEHGPQWDRSVDSPLETSPSGNGRNVSHQRSSATLQAIQKFMVDTLLEKLLSYGIIRKIAYKRGRRCVGPASAYSPLDQRFLCQISS